jgi:hypothetical protein
MRLDYIVSRIEASQDGALYAYIIYSNSVVFKAGTDNTLRECPFGPNITTTTSPEDLMRKLPKAMANIGNAMSGGFSLFYNVQNQH